MDIWWMKQCLEKPWHLTYIKLTTRWSFCIVKMIFWHRHWDVFFVMHEYSLMLIMYVLPDIQIWQRKLKHRKRTSQNNCMWFCWQLDKLKYIFHEKFGHLFKLVTHDLNIQKCVSSIVFKYFNVQCPNLNGDFDVIFN